MSQAKAIIAVILVIIIGLVGYFIKHQAEEIGELTTTVTNQKIVIDANKKAEKLQAGSTKIDGDAVATNAKDNRAISAAVQATSDKSNLNEAQVRRKYDQLLTDARARQASEPPAAAPSEDDKKVAALEKEKADSISATRLEGLWEQYCQDQSNPSCPVSNDHDNPTTTPTT